MIISPDDQYRYATLGKYQTAGLTSLTGKLLPGFPLTVYFLFCKVWPCPATKEENTETNGHKNHHSPDWLSYFDGL